MRSEMAVLDVAARGFLWLVACSLGLRVLRGSSAASRHAVRSLAFAGLLLMPVLAATLPTLQWIPTFSPTTVSVGPTDAIDVDPMTASLDVRRSWAPGQVLALIWCGGALVLLASFAGALIRARGLVRRARPAAEAWRRAASQLAIHSGARLPAVLASDEVAAPMTTGFLRPVILIPATALGLPAPWRNAVILHELAHVSRFDCASQWLAQIACSVHWFNPLAWLFARRLRLEREQAADDCVLGKGIRATDYADMLMDLARNLRRPTLGFDAAVSMADPSQLEGRVHGLLDTRRPHGTASRKLVAIALALALAVLLPTASLGVETTTTSARETPSQTETGAGRGEPSRVARYTHEMHLNIAVNGTGKVSSSSIARFSVGDSKVVTVQNSELNTLAIQAHEPGSTDILFWGRDGDASVVHVTVIGAKKPSSSEPKGTMDKRVVAEGIRKHLSELKGCYETEVPKDPAVSVRLVLEFTIDLNGAVQSPVVDTVDLMGTVQDATADATPFSAPSMSRCVVEHAGSWKFPPPTGGRVTVKYPFVFLNQ